MKTTTGSPRIFSVAFPTISWFLFLFVTFKYMRHFIHDGDTWWHLANGRYMLAHHVFLRADVFSHTLKGQPWINFEWLSEIFMAGIVGAFGVPGLFWAKVFFGMTCLGLLILLLRASGGRGPLVLIFTWAGYDLLQARLCTRVELVSLNFIPLLIILILRIPHLSIRQQKIVPALFFGLFVLWCNAHAGFLYGILILGCFAIGARHEKWTRDTIATLDRSLVISLLAIFANPYGLHLFEPFMQHVIDFKNAPGLIAEWDQPSWASAPLFWGATILFVITLIHFALRKKRIGFLWIPACLASLLFGLITGRNTYLIAFTVFPFLAATFPSIDKKRTEILLWTLAILLIGAVDKDYLTKPLAPGMIDANTYPVGAIDFVRKNDVQGVLYNSYGFGGPIEWELGPERGVFMDGRYIFYPLLAENQALMSGKMGSFIAADWQNIFNRYGIDYAITKYEPLRLHRDWNRHFKHESVMNIMFPRTLWALVYWDDAALVFLKRTPKFEALIVEKEYQWAQPYDIESMVNGFEANEFRQEDLMQELKRHQNETGKSWRELTIRRFLPK